jgi:DNA-binding XRE family transcriptional regulator
VTLKQWRAAGERRISQETLAKYLGVCLKSYWNYENRTPPRWLWVIMQLVPSADLLPEIGD